jgi:hypothetical protein
VTVENNLPDSEEAKRGPEIEGRAANHFEVAFTEFEFLLDFGQVYGKTREPLLHTRIIMTPHSTKTFLRMCQEIVEQYESTIGPILEQRT